MIILDENRIKLCCGGKGCPIIEDLGNGKVRITDDDGSAIICDADQAKLITKAVEHLEQSNTKDSEGELLLG